MSDAAGGTAFVVSAEFPPEHFGGGGAYASSLARALERRHSRVEVVVNTRLDQTTSSAISPSVTATFVGMRSRPHLSGLSPDAKVVWGAGRTAAVLSRLRAHQAAVLVAVDYFSAVSSLNAGLSGPRLALACLQSAAGREAAGVSSPDEGLRQEVERLCNEMGWVFLCPSEAEKALILRRYPGANAHVVYPALDPTTLDRAGNREQPRPDSVAVRVGYVGRLAPEKAPDRLLATAEALRSKRNFELVVVTGDVNSPEASELRSSGAEVRGWLDRNDLLAFYQGLDVLFLPSRYESFGLVAIEAASVGAAVVMSIETGAREVLGGHPGCFVTNCDNVGDVLRDLERATRWRRSGNPVDGFAYPGDDRFSRALFSALDHTY